MNNKINTTKKYLIFFIAISFMFFVAGCTIPLDDGSITLSEKNVVLFVGDETTITAILPEDLGKLAINWVSERPDIVTVDAGTLMGISEGDTHITVIAGNLSAKISVKVKNPDQGALATALEPENFLNVTMSVETTISVNNIIIESFDSEILIGGQNSLYRVIGDINLEQYIVFYNNKLYLVNQAKPGNGLTDWKVEELSNQLDFTYFSEFSAEDFIFEDGYYELDKNQISEYISNYDYFPEVDLSDILSLDLKLKVQNGFLRQLFMETVYIEEDIQYSVSITIDLSDFGTTNVLVPESAYDAINNYKPIK